MGCLGASNESGVDFEGSVGALQRDQSVLFCGPSQMRNENLHFSSGSPRSGRAWRA
jgi:hypothetical protein